jgi:hypothetical protein
LQPLFKGDKLASGGKTAGLIRAMAEEAKGMRGQRAMEATGGRTCLEISSVFLPA